MAHENDRLIKLPGPPVPPGKPASAWEYVVAYLCIWFLAVVLILVYFTSTGSPQAGLIEVGIFTSIFVFLFHLVLRFFPIISKIFSSVVIIGLGIALIYVNYYFLKVVKKDASFEELLIGDLLIRKIIKTAEEDQTTVAAKQKRGIPEYEKLLPVISLDQLEEPIAKPMKAGLRLASVTRFFPTAKTGPLSFIEEYKTEVPKCETSIPAVSRDQLKKFIPGMVKAKRELPYMATIIPMMEALPVFASIDTAEPPISNIMVKASHLEFTGKSEPMIQEGLERNGISLSPLLKSIQEITIMPGKVQKIQPPLPGTIISFPMINLKEPLREKRIPID